jgi:hypothetical protein
LRERPDARGVAAATAPRVELKKIGDRLRSRGFGRGAWARKRNRVGEFLRSPRPGSAEGERPPGACDGADRCNAYGGLLMFRALVGGAQDEIAWAASKGPTP